MSNYVQDITLIPVTESLPDDGHLYGLYNNQVVRIKVDDFINTIDGTPPIIKHGTDTPTNSTEGKVGQHCINVDTGKIFVCRKITTAGIATSYTWEQIPTYTYLSENFIQNTKVKDSIDVMNNTLITSRGFSVYATYKLLQISTDDLVWQTSGNWKYADILSQFRSQIGSALTKDTAFDIALTPTEEDDLLDIEADILSIKVINTTTSTPSGTTEGLYLYSRGVELPEGLTISCRTRRFYE